MAEAHSEDPAAADPLVRLQELAVLRDMGALSSAEFEAQKALVLSPADSDWRAAPADDAGGA